MFIFLFSGICWISWTYLFTFGVSPLPAPPLPAPPPLPPLPSEPDCLLASPSLSLPSSKGLLFALERNHGPLLLPPRVYLPPCPTPLSVSTMKFCLIWPTNDIPALSYARPRSASLTLLPYLLIAST